MTLAMSANGKVAREPFRTIGARFPTEICDQIDADAARLGLSVSDWMRMVVHLSLGASLNEDIAASYRSAPNRRPGR